MPDVVDYSPVAWVASASVCSCVFCSCLCRRLRRRDAAKVGPASAEISFSHLLPEGGALHSQEEDFTDGLRDLLRDLEQACSRKLAREADRKDALLQACQRWTSRQVESERRAEVELHRWSASLRALIEREWDTEGLDCGGATFRKLKPKVLAEWRAWRGQQSQH